MAEKTRKTREERTIEIWQAAKKCFLAKSYAKTTMEDIIAETELSKGGFYHYYSSKKEIILDMMQAGNKMYMKRNPYMLKVQENITKEQKVEILLDALIEKSLVITDDRKVFTMFTYEMMFDDDIWKAYEAYESDFFRWLCVQLNISLDNSSSEVKFISRFMNALLMTQHTFRDGEIFIQYKEEVKNMLRPFMEKVLYEK